jgi:Fe-S-cluster containining protein
LEEVRAIVEVAEIPPVYMEHLSDPEMAPIYYPWKGSHYRLQMKFVKGSCIALIPRKGCLLGEERPLICRVWPFWWKEGSKPSMEEDFPLEINGECTMVSPWHFSYQEVLKELGLSEMKIRRELFSLNLALEEHGRILKIAREKGIPPEGLLDWFFEGFFGKTPRKNP